MSRKDNETLLKQKNMIIRHLQSKIKALEETIDEKDEQIDKLDDKLSSLEILIAGLEKPKQTCIREHLHYEESIKLARKNTPIIETVYPEVVIAEPDSKSLKQIWDLLDKYVQVGQKRFGPAKMVDHFKKLGKSPSSQWSQFELDATAKMLLEDIVGGMVLVQKSANVQKRGQVLSPRKGLVPFINSCKRGRSPSENQNTASNGQHLKNCLSKLSINSDYRRIEFQESQIPQLHFKLNSSGHSRTPEVFQSMENSPRQYKPL